MTQFFVKLRQFLNSALCSSLLVLLSLLPSASLASDRASDDTISTPGNQLAFTEVGTVSLTLGKAYVDSRGQSRQRLRAGSLIRVGDLITTGSNGHVHIQFADNAYVSIRPSSLLEIVNYEFNADEPELSSVKFNLKEGVTRSISGAAARSARQRFRLNTPIAAIGVRGTDFVVSATEDSVRALVNEGIIVMAPFSVNCRADAFGPCGENAVELAGNSLQIIELDNSLEIPRLLPLDLTSQQDLSSAEDSQPATVAGTNAATSESDNLEKYQEAVTSPVVATAASLLVGNQPPTSTDPVPQPQPQPEPEPQLPDFTPELPITVASTSQRQLVWGRFAAQDVDGLERISLPVAEARENRSVAVGNFEHVLFRTDTNGGRVEKGLGIVGFQLSSAQAFYDSASGSVAMQVRGGALSVDFQENTFATNLNLDHVLTGPIDFFASGNLFDGGHFNSRNDSQRIAGSVSFDGTEAGYFFEQQLANGRINGLTLWDSK